MTAPIRRPECLQQTSRHVAQKKRPKLFGIGAAWLRFASEVELRRLAILHVRIERKKRALADLRGERDVIARRCEKRMQRAAGKTVEAR